MQFAQGKSLHKDLQICTLKAMPLPSQTLWIFGFSWTPPWQKTENKPINLHREKVFTKTCKSAHIGFWVLMHYVTTLCDKYFLSYYGFSAFVMGRSRYIGFETWCKGKMWPKEDCCICPIPFSWIWTPFAAMCLLKLWFFMNHLL